MEKNGNDNSNIKIHIEKKPVKKVGFLLALGIFLMPYIFSWFTLRTGHTKKSKIIAFIWLFFVLIIILSGENKNENTKNLNVDVSNEINNKLKNTEKAVEKESPKIVVNNSVKNNNEINKETKISENGDIKKAKISENKIDYLKESCLRVTRLFDASSKLSDLQRDNLWEDYEGKTFKWKLVVSEVSKDLFRTYTVHYKCIGSSSFYSDIIVTYPKSAGNMLLEFDKGSIHTMNCSNQITA